MSTSAKFLVQNENLNRIKQFLIKRVVQLITYMSGWKKLV